MAWLFLLGAIAAEVGATTCMKLSDGISRLWPSLGMVGGYVVSFGLFAVALKRLEVGTAYAVWSGIGTAAIAVIGMLLLGESMNWVKGAGLLLIIAGVAAVNVGAAH